MSYSLKMVLAGSLLFVVACDFLTRYLHYVSTPSVNTCCVYQMWIEKAKAQWALENGKSGQDTPTEAEVLTYMKKITPMWCGVKYRHGLRLDRMPACVVCNRKYILGSVSERVQCGGKIEGHRWGVDWDDKSFLRHYRKRSFWSD